MMDAESRGTWTSPLRRQSVDGNGGASYQGPIQTLKLHNSIFA